MLVPWNVESLLGYDRGLTLSQRCAHCEHSSPSLLPPCRPPLGPTRPTACPLNLVRLQHSAGTSRYYNAQTASGNPCLSRKANKGKSQLSLACETCFDDFSKTGRHHLKQKRYRERLAFRMNASPVKHVNDYGQSISRYLVVCR